MVIRKKHYAQNEENQQRRGLEAPPLLIWTGGDNIPKIKEKPTVRGALKEKAGSSLKAHVRHGLDDGTDHLRSQLRDTVQHGQGDDYGGDQIEDTAAAGGRRVERAAEKLLKGRETGRMGAGSDGPPLEQSDPGQHIGTDIQTAQTHTTRTAEYAKIKTRENVAQRDMMHVGTGNGIPRTSPKMRPAAGAKSVLPQKDSSEHETWTLQGNNEMSIQNQGRSLARKQAERGQSHTTRVKKSGEVQRTPADWSGTDFAHSNHAVPENIGSPPRASSAHAVRDGGRHTGFSLKTARSGPETIGRTSRKAVKTAEHTSQKTIKAAGKAARGIQKNAVAAAKATQQTARVTARSAVITAKSAAKAAVAAGKAAIAAVKSLLAAIAAGGWIAVVIVILICIVGLLVASPFGVFFAGDDEETGSVSPASAVTQISGELADHLNSLWMTGAYDRVEILGQPPAWPDVLAVFAARTAGAEDGISVAVLDSQRVDLLREVFWDMVKTTTEEKKVEYPAVGTASAWTETVLSITITPRTPDDMRVFYSFTARQNAALDDLLANRDMLTALVGDLSISSQDAKDLLAALQEDLSPERRAVVETACRLVGKVTYFWGGKSLVLGWDGRWGTLQKVWAEGSTTTGTWRTYGLDCSGFVDWVFYNITGGEYVIGHGGGAHAQHTYCIPISWEDALPGDLVFYPDDEHVGIVGGRDERGNLLVIHCASSKNNVVITDAGGFTAVARPVFYGE